MKPKFVHDCEGCTFLGNFEDCDVYICGTSVIARHSDEPGEYHSMPKSILVQRFSDPNWIEDWHTRAIVAGITCHNVGELPRHHRKFESIREVKNAVDKLRWDMVFSGSDSDAVPPDPVWGPNEGLAFHHYYAARALLEQAMSHLEIADIHDREGRKFLQAKKEAEDGRAQGLAANSVGD